MVRKAKAQRLKDSALLTTEESFMKLTRLAEMDKLTSLTKDLLTFIDDWKPLMEFLHEKETL